MGRVPKSSVVSVSLTTILSIFCKHEYLPLSQYNPEILVQSPFIGIMILSAATVALPSLVCIVKEPSFDAVSTISLKLYQVSAVRLTVVVVTSLIVHVVLLFAQTIFKM